MNNLFSSRRSRNPIWPMVSMLLLSGVLSSIGGAEPIRSAPPKMPAQFDRTTVQHLIDDIEQGQNATILKVGYFLRRGRPELPLLEGFSLLNEAIAKEIVGSKRWVTLQSLRGASAFRIEGVDPKQAFESYDLLFDNYEAASKNAAVYEIGSAIQEFAFTVGGRLYDLGLSRDERTRNTMLKAWASYIFLLGQGKLVKPEPNWVEAIEKSSMREKFKAIIEKELTNPQLNQSYGFVYTAASVLYDPSSPASSLKLLQRAEPLLPKNNIKEARRYFDTLASWLEANNDLSGAVAAQNELVASTNTGYAHLVTLYGKKSDTEAINTVVTLLSRPDANESEINDTAVALAALQKEDNPSKQRGLEQAVQLLSAYLNAERNRDVNQELRARESLGLFYRSQGKAEAARGALSTKHIKTPLPSREAKRRYDSIQRQLQQLNTSSTSP